MEPDIPIAWSLRDKISCETVSKAFWKSINTAPTDVTNVTQLLRLSVLVSWFDSLNLMPCFAWVYTCNTRATIISNEVQIPFHSMHFRISSVTDIIRLRAIIIKQ